MASWEILKSNLSKNNLIDNKNNILNNIILFIEYI